MDAIRLPGGVWHVDLDAPLGDAGGFGAVFKGESDGGQGVAIKRLHIDASDAAHRELAIAAELSDLNSDHVISVLDAGQDADSDRYFIVMPVADESLQDYLERESPVPEIETAQILAQIAAGLADASAIIHRDLKPGNVLSLEGRWQIADFGIARFVEATTSAQTLKAALSPAFAAPEQWRFESATAATDVYALGCVAIAMLTGSPPFTGSMEEMRNGHLNIRPTITVEVSPAMRSLLAMMLRKAPSARPSLGRIRSILETMVNAQPDRPNPGLERLADAAARHEAELSRGEATRLKEQEVVAQRVALQEEASAVLEDCFEALAKMITEAIPTASTSRSSDGRLISVANATLEIDMGDSMSVLGANKFPRSGWDVVCGSAIEVREAGGDRRSASLWYTRQNHPQNNPRWYEVGYRGTAFAGFQFEHEPTAVSVERADQAHSPAMGPVTTAYPPKAIDDEDLPTFCDRWVHILSAAADGQLKTLPGSLPSVD